MGVRLTILTVLVFVLASTSAYAIACADYSDSEFNSLVCYSAPDSALGLGAVDVCGECFPCGVSDNVCPEDFYNDNTGRGSCRFCPDPDCIVTINGTVEDTSGVGITGAQVIALYEPDIKEVVANTTNGAYTGTVRTGFNRLFVRYQDFDSRIVKVDILRLNTGVVKTINFTDSFAIEPGTCSASCTDNYGSRCKASCDGINGCEFVNYSISTLCDDKQAGSRVFLPGSSENYILCCEDNNVQGQTIYSTADERIQSEIGFREDFSGGLRGGADDLVTFTQRTRSKGERVNLQVVVWGSQGNK